VTPARDPDLMTVDEVAADLGFDRKSVYAGAARGEIPHRRVGRRFVFSRRALDAWKHHSVPADRGNAGDREKPRRDEEEGNDARLS
jgi:excisionase family DNA binding protein